MATMRQQIEEMKKSIFDEGHLTAEGFRMIENAISRLPSHSVEDVFRSYFRITALEMAILKQAIMDNNKFDKNGINFSLQEIDKYSFGIGAIKVRVEIENMMELLDGGNKEVIRAAFKALKMTIDNLREKLGPYFQMVRLDGPSETAQRPL